MAAVYNKNIVINTGSTFNETYNLRNPDETSYSLVGAGMSAILKKHPGASTGVGFAMTSTDLANGELKLTMTATDTNKLKEGRYRYDVLVTESGGDKVHIIEGSAMVRAGVTT